MTYYICDSTELVFFLQINFVFLCWDVCQLELRYWKNAYKTRKIISNTSISAKRFRGADNGKMLLDGLAERF